MLYQTRSYFKFLWKSTNQHGVHSPFVFALVTRCFYDKKKHSAYKLLSSHRRALRGNKNKLQVKDLGAGSRVFTSNQRPISAIAKNAGITPKRAKLLNRLLRYLKVENALELGTSLGLGTAAMAVENSVRVQTIEGCAETAGIAAENFRRWKLDNIEVKVGEFEQVLEELLVKKGGVNNYSLVYFDGNHQKEATLRYFEKLLPFAHNDSVFIFDDIHWSAEMEEAWEQIKAHPSVRVSIDTFQWGLVFFRREQAKEHFVIRV